MTAGDHRAASDALRTPLRRHNVRRGRERWIAALLRLCAWTAVLTTLGIVYVLVGESLGFFARVSLWDFLSDDQWTPLFSTPHFGIGVLLSGTLTAAAIALLVAVPLGTAIAVWLAEFARPRVRELVKPLLELLGSIPTIVLGWFALTWVTPALQWLIPGLPGFNLLAAGLVMGLLIVPFIASISEDAMHAVPMALREGAYALGATRLQTALRVVLPAAGSGVAAAHVLGISRAFGETMIVAVAAGLQPRLGFDPTQSAATITSYMVQVALGDLPHGSAGYQTLFAAGLALFVLTLAFNLLALALRRRMREALR